MFKWQVKKVKSNTKENIYKLYLLKIILWESDPVEEVHTCLVPTNDFRKLNYRYFLSVYLFSLSKTFMSDLGILCIISLTSRM